MVTCNLQLKSAMDDLMHQHERQRRQWEKRERELVNEKDKVNVVSIGVDLTPNPPF